MIFLIDISIEGCRWQRRI